ncbi:MAG: amidohydrolase family protein [Thermoanaerobaculia bacterium]|nr:amidohydrolase family protein [Thermoanaerobaculia bacterium]
MSGERWTLRGGTVLTLDGEARIVPSADVVVEAGRIAAVGPGAGGAAAPGDVELDGDLVLPGLIQGHLHLGQTLFRGLAEGRRLLPWLRERIWPLEAAHDDESAYWSTLLGASECLLGGTTMVQEIGIGPGARGLLEGLRDSGLRAQAGLCLMDSGDGLPRRLRADTEATLVATEELGGEFDGAAGGRLRYLLNPRFLLSCSDPLWAGVRELAERRGWAIHTHALEQREEGQEVLRLKGADEIEYFDRTGILAQDFRIAHGVWLTHEHLERVRGRRFSVVHCPSSNCKLGSGICDLPALKAAGIPVGVGTDGAACSNTLDALAEVRLAALLQSLERGPGSFRGVDALRLATSEGARALGLEDELGSVEPGKRADLLVLSRSRPELWGAAEADLHDLVVYGATRAAVRRVVVGGETVVEEGRLTRLDPQRIRTGAARSLKRLLERAKVTL